MWAVVSVICQAMGFVYVLHGEYALPSFIRNAIDFVSGPTTFFAGATLGFFAAKRYGGVFDHLSLVGSLLGISIPIFFLGLILKWVFAVKLGWLPSIGRESVLSTMTHPTNFYGSGQAWILPNGTQNTSPSTRFIARGCLNCHNSIHGSNAPADRGKFLIR